MNYIFRDLIFTQVVMYTLNIFLWFSSFPLEVKAAYSKKNQRICNGTVLLGGLTSMFCISPIILSNIILLCRYQIFLCLLASIGCFIPAMVVVAMTFLAYEPDHR